MPCLCSLLLLFFLDSSEDDLYKMSHSEQNKNKQLSETTKVVLAAVIGAGVGAAVTLLFTTDKGAKMLDVLKSPIKAAEDSLDQLAQAAREAAPKAKETATAVSDTVKPEKE